IASRPGLYSVSLRRCPTECNASGSPKLGSSATRTSIAPNAAASPRAWPVERAARPPPLGRPPARSVASTPISLVSMTPPSGAGMVKRTAAEGAMPAAPETVGIERDVQRSRRRARPGGGFLGRRRLDRRRSVARRPAHHPVDRLEQLLPRDRLEQ